MLFRMRRWRAIAIAGGVLLIAGILVLRFTKPTRVSAQVFGETNGYRRVMINNPTAHPYYVNAWGEFYSNDAWERLPFSNAMVKVVEPGTFLDAGILMPTNRPRRVVFVYVPIKTSGPGLWINRLKARLRLKPDVDQEYIAVD